MKIQLSPLFIALGLSGLIASPVMAATSADSAQIAQLSEEIAQLQNQVNSLKGQVEAKNYRPTHQSYVHGRPVKNKKQSAAGSSDDSSDSTDQDATTKPTRAELVRMINEEREFLPFDLDVPGQAFVSTGPYVGVPIQYAGSELIVNSPSVNTDVQLLGIRKHILEQLNAMGGEIFKEPYHSHLLFSGLVEAQAGYFNPGGSPSTSDIDLTSANLDAFFLGPSEWTLGFMEFNYDSSPPNDSYYTVSNSRVYINKAFITIGNFQKSPVYGTVGQYYVPFGTYSTVMVSDPLTKLITRTKARALLVGYQEQELNGFYGAGYIFRGDSHAASVSKINNGGLNAGYHFEDGKIGGNVGAGVIGNIADSGGMQDGNGFSQYEQITHRVPGYNLRGLFNIGENWNFIAEYVGASTSFNPNDMSYNGRGAKPSAFDLEAAYSFYLFERPSSVGVAYAKSNEALSLGIPLTRTGVVFNTSVWRNTLQSLELRHDTNYAASDTANGPVGAETATDTCTASSCSSTGKSDNAVTAQFDYYF